MRERTAIGNWRRWPFGAHLAITYILLTAAALAGVTWYSTTQLKQTLTDQIGAQLQVHAESVNRLVALYLQEKIADLRAIAMARSVIEAVELQNRSYDGDMETIRNTIAARDATWLLEAGAGPLTNEVTSSYHRANPAGNQLHAFLSAFAEHSEVFVTDRYGATIAATGPLSDYDQSDETWWQSAWREGAGAIYLARPAFDESAQLLAMVVAVPVRSYDGETTIGILRSTLSVDSILEVIATLRTGQTGYAMLADPEGPLYVANGDGDHTADLLRVTQLLESNEAELGFRVEEDALYAFARLREAHFDDATEKTLRAEIARNIEQLDLTTVVRQDRSEALAIVGVVQRSAQTAFLIAVVISLFTAALAGRFVTRPLIRLAAAAEEIGKGNLNAPLPAVYSGEMHTLTENLGRMAGKLQAVLASLSNRTAELVASSTSLAREVAERKQAEAQLSAYRDQLEIRVAERTKELEAARQELEKGERLAAIGRLTERIAKELRSPLGTISATLFLLRQKKENAEASKYESAIQRAERAIRRCDQIVEELFAYAEHQQANPQETDLDAWLEKVLEALQLPDRVTMTRSLHSGETVGIDREQLRAAVESVVANAFEAVDENQHNGGHIQIETHTNQDRIEIRIADDGPGVDPALGPEILEPLQSTRESGIGIGLSRAKLIMEEHAGGLEFTSEPGAGATFTLWLPKAH